jgi:hypothetical protein
MFANRARGAVLVAALAVAAVVGGTTAAQARDTGTIVADPVGTLQSGPGDYAHHWQGHDRTMTLYYDGFGTMTMSDGAVDGEQWNVKWVHNDGVGITVVLQDRTAVYGAGLGGWLSTGMSWKAELVAAPDTGVTVLHFGDDTYGSMGDPNVGFFWCAPDIYGTSTTCGA